MDPVELLNSLRQLPPMSVYAILFFGALLEYVFPPFPGDSVVLVGAVLVTAFDWSLSAVFLTATAGSVVGGMAGWTLGDWMRRTDQTRRLGPKQQKAVRLATEGFARHGAAYIAVNRFLPGVRSLFFVAAGLAGLRPLPVLLWSAVAAGAWNAILIGAGILLGGNLEQMAALVAQHNAIAGVIVAAVIAVVAWRLYKAVQATPDPPEDV